MSDRIKNEIATIYKTEAGKVLASLVRILGDLDLAEEGLQDAFKIALEKWPVQGIPANPYSWLKSTAKFKAIDSIRRLKRGKELFSDNDFTGIKHYTENTIDEIIVDDDQLRLIILCCHPLLPPDAQIALTLRDVCGLTTEEIANAYHTSSETIKKRISRAKARFREKKIPYEIPGKSELTRRTDAVLHVIYLIFNEGYAASSGEIHVRKELTDEAIFLSRKVVELFATPESMGLLSLLLLHESRRLSRVTKTGEIIPLEHQDRSLWDKNLINEALQLLQQAIMPGRLGPYTLQAAIVSVHAMADSLQNTRWDLIIDYYDMLLSIHPSPVIKLNRSIAVGMQQGPEAALQIINELLKEGTLNTYHLIYSAQAEFLKKAGFKADAIKAYKKAIELVHQKPEQHYLEKQLYEILK